MKDVDRQTRSYLMELFNKHGINPRTDLGQNFLIDLNIIEYIVDQAELEATDVVLEVGTGTGGMTTFMAQQAAEVISVELDTNMHTIASGVVERYDNVTLLHCDALKNKNSLNPEVIEKVQEKLAEDPARQLKLVANLPYNVATPIVSNLVATDIPWARMVVTIQLELGQRMQSYPGKSAYGALSVWLQSQCRVKLLKTLQPTVFWPRPKVNSAIVRLLPNKGRAKNIHDRAFFHEFIRRLFHQRRKQARSVLAGMYRKQLSKPAVDAILQSLNFEPTVRAESLDIDALVNLSNTFYKAIQRAEQIKLTTDN
ncbi:SSU rRNA (adenine(1518)-N(6)/adenine(1519)-N(6))-dimethyltransferase [hydrothermal vent metagenome]|uniref:SSU rRNA (Adenine(1518)-N(6)/adenine(1519)-N(6))-dimethyltransferase n=1 Tax=hydrothermal vent metagenome TaxID=652676 RepID=A0A3B1DZK4_9ZZZZ